MQIFVTADHHLGHAKILEYAARPFSSVEEMDQELIRRWNEVVGEEDVVYHLGDFTLSNKRRASYYLSQLRGQIKMLSYPWHHDCRWIGKVQGIEYLPPIVIVQDITLCHFPMAAWNKSHYGALHYHGHSHGKMTPMKNRIDVGVDCHNFYPVNIILP